MMKMNEGNVSNVELSNNPILFFDPDGNDNVVYLVYVPGDDPELSEVTAEGIAREANKMYKELGLKTRVVVFDESKRGKFNEDYMDATDSYAVVGTDKEIINRTALTRSGKDLEKAQPGRNKAGVFTSQVEKYMDELPFTSVEQALAFGLVHGTGHNADHTKSTKHGHFIRQVLYDEGVNYVNFMAQGPLVLAVLGELSSGVLQDDDYPSEGIRISGVRELNPDIVSLMDLFDPSRNKTVIDMFKDDRSFGNNDHKDNYDSNRKEAIKQQATDAVTPD